MKRVRTYVILGVGVLCAGLYFVSPWCAALSNDPEPFLSAVPQATTVRLYEGLPHQNYEQELLTRERQSKDVFEVAGYPFYRAPMTVPETDVASLNRILAARTTYEPHTGTAVKFCGGFHPDYAVEYQAGTRRWYALLCFGCGDVWLVGPGAVLKNDIAAGKDELVSILKGYVKNRPVSSNYPNQWRFSDFAQPSGSKGDD